MCFSVHVYSFRIMINHDHDHDIYEDHEYDPNHDRGLDRDCDHDQDHDQLIMIMIICLSMMFTDNLCKMCYPVYSFFDHDPS